MEEQQEIPEGAIFINEEVLQKIRDAMPGETLEQKTEGLLTFSVLFLAGFIASMPEGVQEEAHKDVVGAIDSMVIDLKAQYKPEAEAPEAAAE